MHPPFLDAERMSRQAIGAAIGVHSILGPGLLESIYEQCLLQEFALRGMTVATQEFVSIEYKGLLFKEELKFVLLVSGVLLIEIKAVQEVHPVHKAQLMSDMQLLDVPVGLLMTFHQIKLVYAFHG